MKRRHSRICAECGIQFYSTIRDLRLCMPCAALPAPTPSPPADPIQRPNHYTWHPSGVECKTIVSAFSYNLGTAIAYIWRAERKNGVEDLRKAIRHLEFELERLEAASKK
jgi:hypothetical protein